jgi:hypothetical protein
MTSIGGIGADIPERESRVFPGIYNVSRAIVLRSWVGASIVRGSARTLKGSC